MVVVTGNGTTTVRDKTKVNKNDMSKSHLIKQYRVSETGLSLVQKELMRQIEKRKEGHVSVVEEDKEVEEW